MLGSMVLGSIIEQHENSNLHKEMHATRRRENSLLEHSRSAL